MKQSNINVKNSPFALIILKLPMIGGGGGGGAGGGAPLLTTFVDAIGVFPLVAMFEVPEFAN